LRPSTPGHIFPTRPRNLFRRLRNDIHPGFEDRVAVQIAHKCHDAAAHRVVRHGRIDAVSVFAELRLEVRNGGVGVFGIDLDAAAAVGLAEGALGQVVG